MFGFDKMWWTVLLLGVGCRSKIDLSTETEERVPDDQMVGAGVDCDDADSSQIQTQLSFVTALTTIAMVKSMKV